MINLPEAKGAYLLVIVLDAPLPLDIASLRPQTLAPGRYAYCGSAYGPAGIRARVARHLRRAKIRRWHIDHMTGAGPIVEVHAVPGGRECDLFDRVLASPGATVPMPGFGSSDCRRCPAHLAQVGAAFEAALLVNPPPSSQAWQPWRAGWRAP